jgi:ABC-2 type transport system ATP-binding protein
LSEDLETVISIRGLRKSYGEVEAVRGIDLDVRAGEVFAFLGPNGAGKTTTVEILEGYRKRSAGEVSVLGEDPERAGRGWRERIGVVLQGGRLEPYLTVAESLALYAGYYRAPRPVEEVIEAIGLAGKADERAGRLSGGQQRRLDVGMALVGDPDLLFLDEPTTGFDPSARRQAWDVIAALRDLGKTLLPHHPLHGRGRSARHRGPRSRGGDVSRAGRPRTRDRDASRPDHLQAWRPRGLVGDGDAGPDHQRADRRGARTGARSLENLEVTRPSLEERLTLELDRAGTRPSGGRRAADDPAPPPAPLHQKVFWRNPARSSSTVMLPRRPA